MKNRDLQELNFNKLLNYENGWPHLNKIQDTVWFDPPIKCNGYCTSCEDNGFIDNFGIQLDLMTHASDSHDFECLLGPLHCNVKTKQIDSPIMFVLESAGGNYGHGRSIDWNGVSKSPPINTYYFVPYPSELNFKWPDNPAVLSKEDLYSPYFAFIMNQYHLKNVYITNIVKCRGSKNGTFIPFRGLKRKDCFDNAVRKNCYDQIFKKELELFRPSIIFAFGNNAYNCLDFAQADFPDILVKQLWHPDTRHFPAH